MTKFSTTQVFTLLSCLLFALPLSAAHLIGGVITYECLGDGDLPNTRKYQLIMRVYRDCASNGAGFDSGPNGSFEATVTIYQGDSSIPFRNLVLDAPKIVAIDPGTDNPCIIIPPNVCVEEGVYTFPIVELPIIDGSYHVSYQRCCRNGTITNINNPGETGVTYSVEITAAAQRVCNDSPVFDNFPPPVVCAGEPLLFDHAATDIDGDQLVYEFCAPLSGGSTTDAGIAPDPDSPPPYSGVGFTLPNFTFLQPLGAESDLQIDETTGFLTGTPTEQGQFVVGICVSEYRNGELLSVIRRDFQFNVALCEVLVSAAVGSDEVVAPQTYVINSCGDPDIFIENKSKQEVNIDSHEWSFYVGNDTLRPTDWDASLTLPDTGQYLGQLVINPNSDCTDTALIEINLFPNLEVDFSFSYDTCQAEAVQFTNLSNVIAEPIMGMWWTFGDGKDTADIFDPAHTYQQPGSYTTELRISDANGCLERQSKVIDYFPVPELLIIEPSNQLGCVPADIFFNNLSVPIDDSYDINWSFGDGNTSTMISPSHVYQDTGKFSVHLAVTSPIGCFTERTFNQLIDIDPSPIADFTFSPDNPSNFAPMVTFTDQSTGVAQWLWNFADLGTSTLQNPAFVFPDTGRFEILLEAFHQSGCVDSMLQVVDVSPQVRYWLPNAFTPNNDGRNDVFQGKGVFVGMEDFALHIFNRYGEMVFSTTDPQQVWNGKYQNTGKSVMSGVYVYDLQYVTPRGETINQQGTLTLLK